VLPHSSQARRVLGADRGTLFVVDESCGELWSKSGDSDKEIRIPLTTGKHLPL
jgi:hypothetical protein